ncbi:MAG: S-layer homology domain-containing protein [Intestinimonas sp.]|uniref:S-layer homology domain-containing protein n=1 Tax=Intestinimonas sp. TaxID=1965293 RepID=UPI002A914DB6|nr:S-layer homology domain-containing protein [Intestinimonas sp.]MDY5339533.1 S-layer homology domain-containing protein [Intestinimonas sp.]
MGASYSSTPLNDVNTAWEVSEAETENCYYIKNAARGMYLEWYAEKSNWSTYGTIAADKESLFAQAFYKVSGDIPTPGGALPAAGDQVVLYNHSSQGVLAGQDDNTGSPSITSAAAELTDGKAAAANGGRVFTVEKNGDYYRFKTAHDGYLCSNGTGNNAFYQQEATEDADWTLAEYNGGFTLESRTAKFNGKYSQYLEYYAGAYKTYSMYNVTDKDIYTFQFYPVADGVKVTDGVVNLPQVVFGTLPDAYVGQSYTFTFTVDAVFGVSEAGLTVKAGETVLTANGDGTYTIPVDAVNGEIITITVTGQDTKGTAISGTAIVAVKDEPVIGAVTPAAGAETGAEKRPVISAEFSNGGEAPVAVLTLKSSGTALDEAVMTVDGGKAVYIPETDLTDGRYTATVTVTRADGKSSGKTWSFTVGQSTERLYFGQLHSHTQYSDGSGTLESALSYVANLPDSANVDFVAFTDHSNYFDKSGAANPEGALYDMSLATAYSQETWNSYKTAIDAFNAENNGKIALGGFEMTWSGGPGHINTFNTEGIVSRNNTALNNKTEDAGLKAYYALLSQPEGVDSLSQFNHPGSTFGTFSDFSYWDALIDSRMYMVEVGNGEGAIGAGGYYPSYEYYTMALDKGWHVAPTNNQDNHKGKWGNANDARDVILTDDFSEQGIYEAIRSHRMYATEDKNLEIYYTVNEQPLGSILEEIPEELSLSVQVSDPDRTDSISKVEVIVNSGRVAYAWDDPAELASGLLSCTLDPTYSYYYIRVTEGDGDMAVTAPVWVGETLKLGISSVVCGTSTPVTDEELTITTTLFNSESADAAVKSVNYTSGGETLGVDAAGYTVPASGSLQIPFRYTPTAAKVMTITVTVLMEQKGVEYEYAMDVTLDVLDSAKLVYIGIDASHYNEYVAGNYKDSMGNFGNLAAGYGVRTVELKSSEELIAACANEKYKALIFTAPSRRLADAQSDPRTYSPAELVAVRAFHEAGGMVILAGWSDNYENYDVIQGNPDIKHMAATQNELLAALGSSLRISDDATYDDVRSAADGVDKWRLYFSSYNWENLLTENVEFDANHPFDRMYTQVFSHYGGASIYAVDASGNPIDTLPETVSPVVFGHATTYSVDVDKDGLGGDSTPQYAYAENDDRLLVMASERQPDRGMVIVSGAAFMSNFEVQATIEDSGSEKNYANYTICENLVQYLNPTSITPIADVQAAESEGVKFTIEGVVTSNASGYDKDTAFFDCIYVQDDTAGINAFPVAGDYKVGDRVRITGTTSSYQGERQIAVTSIKAVGEGNVEPKTITAGQLNDGSVLGSLVTISGTVASFEKANGLVQTIMVRDKNGELARVFIDGYITTGQDVQNLRVGRKITATGLASYDNTFNAPDGPFPRIRIRDRADVVCKRPSSGSSSAGQTIPDPDVPLEPEADETLPFLDVDEDAWYYDAVCYVYGAGLFQGTSGTTFGPDDPMTRSMTATVLYRLSGETYTGTAATFGDMAAGAWYGTGVSWAAAREIAKGYGDGRFGVNDPVTREQLAAILYRYARYKGEDVSVGEDTNLIGFKDAGQVSEWAAPAVRWAVGVGLLKGDAAGCLRPLDQAARSEFAALLMRYVEREQT